MVTILDSNTRVDVHNRQAASCLCTAPPHVHYRSNERRLLHARPDHGGGTKQVEKKTVTTAVRGGVLVFTIRYGIPLPILLGTLVPYAFSFKPHSHWSGMFPRWIVQSKTPRLFYSSFLCYDLRRSCCTIASSSVIVFRLCASLGRSGGWAVITAG